MKRAAPKRKQGGAAEPASGADAASRASATLPSDAEAPAAKWRRDGCLDTTPASGRELLPSTTPTPQQLRTWADRVCMHRGSAPRAWKAPRSVPTDGTTASASRVSAGRSLSRCRVRFAQRCRTAPARAEIVAGYDPARPDPMPTSVASLRASFPLYCGTPQIGMRWPSAAFTGSRVCVSVCGYTYDTE
jgi:hypothetical protein